MFLNQEYISRHSLSQPLILTPDFMYLIFKSDKKKWDHPWMVFHVEKKQPYQYRAPSYDFMIYEPVYCGSEGGHFLNAIDRKTDIYFNNIELQFVKYVQKFKHLTPVADLAEARIVAWEIFVYSCDRLLSNSKYRYINYLYNSLDADLDVKTRIENQIEFLNHCDSSISIKWKEVECLCEPKHYGDWYAKLIYDIRSKKVIASTYNKTSNFV